VLTIFVLIALVGLGLRLWGVRFGLPDLVHLDENFEVNRALRLGAGHLELERIGKGVFFYFLALEYGVLYLTLRVAGEIARMGDFALLAAGNPAPFYLLGRLTNVVFGVGTIWLAFKLARRSFGGAGAALIAAGLLSVSPLHVVNSHYSTVDVLQTLLCSVSLLVLLGFLDDRRWRTLAIASATAGAAVATKATSVVLAVPFLVAVVWASEGSAGRVLKRLGGALLVALVTLAVLEPALVLNFGFVKATVENLFSGARGAVADSLGSSPGFAFLVGYYSRELLHELGAAGVLAVSLGAAYLILKRRWIAVVLLSFVFTLLLAATTSSTGLYFPRYLLPALPVVYVFCGVGAAVAAGTLFRSDSGRVVGMVLLFCVVAAEPLIRSAGESAELGRKDSRTAAREFFEERVPAGSVVLMEGSIEHPSQLALQLALEKAEIDSLAGALDARDPGKARYWKLRKDYPRLARYRVVAVDRHAVWKPLPEYESEGVQYVVVWKERFQQVLRHYGEAALRSSSSRKAFLDQLAALGEGALVRCFGGPGSGLRGPEICIYKLPGRRETTE